MSDLIEILIVDDELDFLETIAERLEQRGFRVTKAASGNKALEAAGAGRFDLALLDLRMPEMDGIELLQALKQNHKYLEVLILTGFGTIESAVECTKLGAFGYLPKSCEIEDLLLKLKEAYAARLMKKFKDDQVQYGKITQALKEEDAVSIWYEFREKMHEGPSLISVLRKLRQLDDEEK